MEEFGNSSESLQAWAPEAPKERIEAEEKENKKLISSVVVIQEMLDWLDKAAEFYGSIDSLEVNGSTTGEDSKVAILTAKGMKTAYESKATEYRNQFAKYLKEADEASAE